MNREPNRGGGKTKEITINNGEWDRRQHQRDERERDNEVKRMGTRNNAGKRDEGE
jgi:hypothetical protein